MLRNLEVSLLFLFIPPRPLKAGPQDLEEILRRDRLSQAGRLTCARRL